MRRTVRGLLGLVELCAFVACAWLHAGAAAPQTANAATLRIGVWTLWHDQAISVAPAGGSHAEMLLCEGCAAVPLRALTKVHAVDGLVAGAGQRPVAAVSFTGPVTLTAHGETLTLREPLRITARGGELVLAVTLPVEAYVERVVASESGAADSAESLKALAIVVRSFALHQRHGHAEHAAEGYDLCDSTHCQLLHWGGLGARQPAAHAATLATASETLWFHGRRAAAWFHQNCGGRTATPDEVWPSKTDAGPIPWLASQADPYCTARGAREWSATVPLAELTRVLADAGLVRPGWTTLTVARRGASGRAVTLRAGATEIGAEDLRLAVGRALGWGRILSNWYEIQRQDSGQGSGQGVAFVFHGRGSGHGVGLCQAGAAAMAAQGRDAGQILAQYFPGAEAADEATGRAWQTLRGQGFVLQTLTAGDAALLPQLEHALAEAQSRSGLHATGAITVRAFRTTEAFRQGTLAPGWVAAFAEGTWIGTQPLATLVGRRLLEPVLRHEFLHALVEEQAGSSAPLWLREGLVEAWADGAADRSAGGMKTSDVDAGLAHAASESESEKAHRAAGWHAQRLLDRYGRAQVLQWLHDGVPVSVENSMQ